MKNLQNRIAMRMFFSLLVVIVCATTRANAESKNASAIVDYNQLLEKFPEDQQGLGPETVFKTIEPQPMTYALVLSAESLHFKKILNDESRRRIRKAAKWLQDNSDIDHDKKPGWGLPQAWDAFADGTTNAPNTPYTITTAIVLNGFLDTLAIPDFWTKTEQGEMENLLRGVVLRWCKEMWQEGQGGGFFWYSPNRCDAIFSVNAPAMYLAAMTRFLNEHPSVLKSAERKLIQSRADDLAQAIVANVHLREGLPFWDYAPRPNPLPKLSPNDLVHQAYILWGIETYRDFPGRVKVPWTREQSLKSITRYIGDSKIHAQAADDSTLSGSVRKQPARLWGTGMALAFDAKFGDHDSAEKLFEALLKNYHSPDLRLYPSSRDTKFYPRQAAHALFGMAYFCFDGR